MSTDVFISHATEDQAIGADVCAMLEARGIACWIAPRNVPAGVVWDEAILDAIESASAFLLILSKAANESSFVKNEVNRAFSQKKAIITFRAEDVTPGRSLELYLARHHWTDGFPPPLEEKVDRLAASISALVGTSIVAPAGVAVAAIPGRVRLQVDQVRPKPSTAFSTGLKPEATRLGSAVARINWRRIAPPLIALAVGAAVAVAATSYFRPASRTDVLAPRLTVSLPQTVILTLTVSGIVPAISVHGHQIAFVATRSGIDELWVRPPESADAQALNGTDGGRDPFWSPDSRLIGFSAGNGGKLMTVNASTGAIQSLCDAPSTIRGATWSRDGVIVFGSLAGGFYKVPVLNHRSVDRIGTASPSANLSGSLIRANLCVIGSS